MRIPRGVRMTGFLLLFGLILAGCGGDGDDTRTRTVLSSRSVDADIYLDLSGDTLSAPALALDTGEVIAGLAFTPPAGPSEFDYRGFLQFSLSSIPADATIEFASLSIYLNGVTLGDTGRYAPFFIDLIDTVLFPAPIVSSDFDSACAATRSFSFRNSDQDNFVEIEVTSLVREAQILALPEFRVRIGFDNEAYMADPAWTRGMVRIYDGADADFAPLLRVDYH
jgi:hypothetical protein